MKDVSIILEKERVEQQLRRSSTGLWDQKSESTVFAIARSTFYARDGTWEVGSTAEGA
jgi:hypothetical protein